MPDTPTPSAERYRCSATRVVDGATVRCILAPHGRTLAHRVRLSGSGRVVDWNDDV